MKVAIGQANGRSVELDVPRLLATRMLIQANSGKGKSWLIRLLAEQLFGKVQVILIDPEGEFASLREKFDYVLVGKGGETPADPRSAALLAHKLLEVKASAVCDLYEMKPASRHAWVRLFLESLIDAPKNLWHPVVIIVDEAHVFCPEKGAGESEASEAMISLATRGRKRGFCAVFATQRLGKLRKDAAAELVNVMIGGTFIDVDRKRAADTLGVYGKDTHDFFNEVRLLERGNFFALGPALCTERVLVKVGAVQTTHPEAGSAKHAAEPPPTPKEIAKLLPKLSDLPKAAEEQARTVAELKAEIRSLKTQLRFRASLPAADGRLIEAAMAKTVREFRGNMALLQRRILEQRAVLERLAQVAGKEATRALPVVKEIPGGETRPVVTGAKIGGKEDRLAAARPESESSVAAHRNGDETAAAGVSNSQRRILRALAELEAIGKESAPREIVAFWAEFKPTGGGFNNYLGGLRTAGLIDYPRSGEVQLTPAGWEAIGSHAPPEAEEIFKRVDSLLLSSQRRILQALRENYPGSLTREQLAESSGFEPTGGGFNNYLGAMRTAGLIEYPGQGQVKAADWLMEV